MTFSSTAVAFCSQQFLFPPWSPDFDCRPAANGRRGKGMILLQSYGRLYVSASQFRTHPSSTTPFAFLVNPLLHFPVCGVPLVEQRNFSLSHRCIYSPVSSGTNLSLAWTGRFMIVVIVLVAVCTSYSTFVLLLNTLDICSDILDCPCYLKDNLTPQEMSEGILRIECLAFDSASSVRLWWTSLFVSRNRLGSWSQWHTRVHWKRSRKKCSGWLSK